MQPTPASTAFPVDGPRILVLGAIELADPAAPGTQPVGSARARRALAALTISYGTVVRADRLADIVWPDTQPANPGAALHTVISRLRTRLAAIGLTERLITRPPGYLLRIDPADCDATQFADLVSRASGMLNDDPEAAAAMLDAALELWRGEPYAEFADDAFVAAESTRLTELWSAAVEDRIGAALALGQPAQAVTLAEGQIATSPLRERPRAQLMLALYRTGRQVEALSAFRDFRRQLDDELGLPPSAELTALETAILRQDPALDGPPARPPDLRPSGRPTNSGNLPVGLPSLIGRDGALVDVIGLLERHRLVTVTGPGGVGKTRLALAAAAKAGADGRYPDGAWLIELAHLRSADSLAEALSSVLQISRTAGRSTEDRLIDYLGSQRALLVLDNCEQLVHGVATLAAVLAQRCPDLTLLATSQVPLNISPEMIFPVQPLVVRNSGGEEQPPAVRLFLERAARVAPGFDPTDPDLAVIAELCRRLDGMPLAIELAASRMRFMTPREVLHRLPDRFHLLRSGDRLAADRQSTLRHVVEWSYDLLDPMEADLFDRLSVFRGGFGLADAAAVARADSGVGFANAVAQNAGTVAANDGGDFADGEADLLVNLGSLVERSMLRATVVDGSESTTFSMLETLRAYGAERLAERGLHRSAQLAHAERLRELVLGGRTALLDEDPGAWVRAIVDRFDDLRAAHAWAADNDVRLALQLIAGLVDWLELQGSAELVGWAEATARRAVASGPADPEMQRLIVTALTMAAVGERFGGDLDRARRLADEALAMVADPADPVRCLPLYLNSEVSLYQGRLADCVTFADQAEPLAQQSGDVLRARWCEMNRLLALAYSGRLPEALVLAEALAGERGLPPHTRAWAQYSLGEVLMEVDPDRAGPMLEQVVLEACRMGDRFLEGVALVSAASVRGRRTDPSSSVPLFRAVIEHWHRIGNWTQRWTTFRTVADILARLGDAESAAALVGAAQHQTRPAPAYGPDADRLEELHRRLQSQLGAQRLTELLAGGAAMSDDEVFSLVRAALAKRDPASPTFTARSPG